MFYGPRDELVVIDNRGNVGIGTSVATHPLTVWSSNATASVRFTQEGAGNIAEFVPATLSPALVPSMFDAFGNLGVHTAPVAALHVVGSNILDGKVLVTSNVYMAANLEVYGNSVTHGNAVTDSDARIKTDLARIDGALDRVCALTGYTFTRLADGARSTGLVAQEVARVLPEAVVDTHDDLLGVAYGNMVGLLVEAIKDLRAEVADLRAEVGDLRGKSKKD